jgi:hypothetical protein
MADEINRVGLGVGLEGGQDVLTELRQIRSEMIAILDAARAVPAQAFQTAARARTQAAPRAQAAREETAAVRTENEAQLRLFSNGQSTQLSLFRQTEQHKTEVVAQETRKREAVTESSNTRALRAQQEIQRQLIQQIDANNRAQMERLNSRNPGYAALQQRAGGKGDPSRPTILQDVDLEREKGEFARRVKEVEDFKEKTIRGHLTRQQRRAVIEEFEFRQKATRPVGQFGREAESEVDEAARAKLRKLELNRRINERAEAMEREHAAKMAEIQKQERAHAAQMAEARNREVAQAEAAADRRYRPGAARTTQLEEKFQAQEREAEAARAKASHEEQARRRREEDQRRAEEAGRRLEAERLEAEERRRERERDPAYQAREAQRRAAELERAHEAFAARPRADLDKDRDTLLRLQRETSQIQARVGGAGRAQALELGTSIRGLQERAAALKAELAAPASMKRTHDQVRAELKDIQAETQRTIERVRRLKETIAGAGVGGGPGGGPPGPRGPLNVPSGALNERGFFTSADMLGRITRNILLYQVVSAATYGLKDYIATSVEAARVANATALDMENAARRSQQSVQGFYEFAEGLRTGIGVSRRSAQQAVAEAAYFSENDPSKAQGLTKAIADIAASRGQGGAQLPDIIEQFRRRESKFYKRYIGKTVEELYLEEAQGIVRRDQDLYVPGQGATPRERRQNNLTERERVSRVVAGFSEERKEMIAVNALLREGDNVAGAAERRMNSLAGQLDRTSERWEDMKVAVGNFVAGLRPLSEVIRSIGDALEGVDFSRLKGTGAGGVVTEADLSRFAQSKRESLLGRTNAFLGDYGTEAALGLGGLAISALAGRGRAREGRRRARYTDVFERALADGLDETAANALATEEARRLRAGVFRSVRVGMGRIGGAISRLLVGVFEFIAGEVAAQRVSALFGRLGTRYAAGRVLSRAGAGGAAGSLEALATGAGGGALAGGVGGALAYSGVGGLSVAGLAGAGAVAAGVIAVAAAVTGLGVAAHSLVTKGDLSEVRGMLDTIRDWWGHAVSGKGFAALQDEETKASLQGDLLRQQREEYEQGRRYFEYQGRRLSARQAGELARDQGVPVGAMTEGRYDDKTWADMQGAKAKAEQDAREATERQELADKNARDAEERARQERINEQSKALQKLREAAQGSFRLVEEIGGALAQDNPFVKVFADGETAAIRMRQQWAFMGEESVRFFTALEQRRVQLQQTRLEFDSLVRVQDLTNRREREAQERYYAPGVSRRDEAALALFGAVREQRDRERQLDTLERGLQGRPDPRGERGRLGDTLAEINEAFLASWSRIAPSVAGQGRSDAFRRLQDMQSQAVLDLTANMTPAQINSMPWLRQSVFGAIGVQRREAALRRQDAFRTYEFQAQEDARLQENLRQARERRQELLARGVDPRQVGRVYDEMFLKRTDDIGVKNLTYDQYVERQAALQREAERGEAERDEAREAVKLGLKYQEQMLGELRALRQGILSGDLSLLVQVLNETQARVDQEDLQEADGAGFNVPLRANTRVNPYTDDFARYGRGGRSN